VSLKRTSVAFVALTANPTNEDNNQKEIVYYHVYLSHTKEFRTGRVATLFRLHRVSAQILHVFSRSCISSHVPLSLGVLYHVLLVLFDRRLQKEVCEIRTSIKKILGNSSYMT
jgi:hypothetical protein